MKRAFQVHHAVVLFAALSSIALAGVGIFVGSAKGANIDAMSLYLICILLSLTAMFVVTCLFDWLYHKDRFFVLSVAGIGTIFTMRRS